MIKAASRPPMKVDIREHQGDDHDYDVVETSVGATRLAEIRPDSVAIEAFGLDWTDIKLIGIALVSFVAAMATFTIRPIGVFPIPVFLALRWALSEATSDRFWKRVTRALPGYLLDFVSLIAGLVAGGFGAWRLSLTHGDAMAESPWITVALVLCSGLLGWTVLGGLRLASGFYWLLVSR